MEEPLQRFTDWTPEWSEVKAMIPAEKLTGIAWIRDIKWHAKNANGSGSGAHPKRVAVGGGMAPAGDGQG